jgi:hypothetical protein
VRISRTTLLIFVTVDGVWSSLSGLLSSSPAHAFAGSAEAAALSEILAMLHFPYQHTRYRVEADMNRPSSIRPDFEPGRLWSLWDMLRSYLPIYQIALDLQTLRVPAELLKSMRRDVSQADTERFAALLGAIIRECPDHGCDHTPELAKRIISRPLPKAEIELVSALCTAARF